MVYLEIHLRPDRAIERIGDPVRLRRVHVRLASGRLDVLILASQADAAAWWKAWVSSKISQPARSPRRLGCSSLRPVLIRAAQSLTHD